MDYARLAFVDRFLSEFHQWLRFSWAFSLFAYQNAIKIRYLSESTLSNDKYTQEMDQSWCTFHGRPLWIVSWINFISDKGVMGIFTFWVTKCYKNHISVHIYPFQQQIHQRNGSILMYYPQLDFGASFLGEFHQLLRFLWAFSLFG